MSSYGLWGKTHLHALLAYDAERMRGRQSMPSACHILTPRTSGCTWASEKDFADMIKDLRWGLSGGPRAALGFCKQEAMEKQSVSLETSGTSPTPILDLSCKAIQSVVLS